MDRDQQDCASASVFCVSRCVAGPCRTVPVKGDHHRRALLRGRPDGHRRTPARPDDGRITQDPDDRGERGRRRRHDRRPTRVAESPPDGYTIFFHHIGHSTAPSLYRKLPYDTINDFEPIGLVSDVRDDAGRAEGFSGQGPQGADRLRQGQQGEGQPGQRRPGRRLAPVRHALHDGDPDGLYHDPLQGHGPGHERPSRRPGGLHVRPDHQHHQPDQKRQNQGLRCGSHDRDPDRPHDRALQGHRPGDERPLGGQVDFMCDQTTNTTPPDQGRQGQGLRGDDQEAGAVAARRADAAGSRHRRTSRSSRVARPVRAQGHAEADHRQARPWPCRRRSKDPDA